MTTQTKVESKVRVAPLLDVFENENEYLLVGDLPGVSPDQLEIKIEKGILTLETNGADPAWEYRRDLRISEDVDAEAIVAKLASGVLELRLPKRAEVRPHRISITTS